LAQICKLIPPHAVPNLAREHKVDEQWRRFDPWSHVVAWMHAHLSHSIGLNDVCDSLEMNSGPLSAIRGATPPCRNTLSHANKVRNAEMAEALYWLMHEHLTKMDPAFSKGPGRRGYTKRFKRAIHVLDSTTIQLVANCMDWAQHRRRKAAAKCHLRLDLQSFLPSYAIIDTAKHHDNTKARELCADLKSGEIAIFDKAYLDFAHLRELSERGIFWVSRAKGNMQYKVVAVLQTTHDPRILSDELIRLTGIKTHQAYPDVLRRVVAIVEVNGKPTKLTFLSDHIEWSAWSIAELYRCRWDIEVFFKEIKQTLQLADFFGYNENAIRWQIWTGLLVHLLLRYLAHLHSWCHSFIRLFTVLRAAMWKYWSLDDLMILYGTARPPPRMCGTPEQAYFVDAVVKAPNIAGIGDST
jgi:hypothetical protein